MSDRKIPLLITGNVPEYLLEKIRTDGYDMKQTGNPTDEELAAAEVIVGFPPVPRLSTAVNLRWLQLPWSDADGYAGHPDFPAHVTLTNATGAFGRPIAEYAFAAVFALMRRSHQYRDCQKDAIWKHQGDLRTVDVHIRRLREKIEKNPSEPKFVHTKWGVGYYFVDN